MAGRPKASAPTHGAPGRGQGRKPDRGTNRGEVILLRVTEADKAEIQAACTTAKRPMSAVALELLLAWRGGSGRERQGLRGGPRRQVEQQPDRGAPRTAGSGERSDPVATIRCDSARASSTEHTPAWAQRITDRRRPPAARAMLCAWRNQDACAERQPSRPRNSRSTTRRDSEPLTGLRPSSARRAASWWGLMRA